MDCKKKRPASCAISETAGRPEKGCGEDPVKEFGTVFLKAVLPSEKTACSAREPCWERPGRRVKRNMWASLRGKGRRNRRSDS